MLQQWGLWPIAAARDGNTPDDPNPPPFSALRHQQKHDRQLLQQNWGHSGCCQIQGEAIAPAGAHLQGAATFLPAIQPMPRSRDKGQPQQLLPLLNQYDIQTVIGKVRAPSLSARPL